jgi:hypothetical protein
MRSRSRGAGRVRGMTEALAQGGRREGPGARCTRGLVCNGTNKSLIRATPAAAIRGVFSPVAYSRGFSARSKRRRLRQQRCLEAASRPPRLAWLMRRVGLIDITVGNAARFSASQRSTTRRSASHHIATQRASRWGHPGGSRAFSVYGMIANCRCLRPLITSVVRRASRLPAESASSTGRHAKGTAGELARCWPCCSR